MHHGLELVRHFRAGEELFRVVGAEAVELVVKGGEDAGNGVVRGVAEEEGGAGGASAGVRARGKRVRGRWRRRDVVVEMLV